MLRVLGALFCLLDPTFKFDGIPCTINTRCLMPEVLQPAVSAACQIPSQLPLLSYLARILLRTLLLEDHATTKVRKTDTPRKEL